MVPCLIGLSTPGLLSGNAECAFSNEEGILASPSVSGKGGPAPATLSRAFFRKTNSEKLAIEEISSLSTPGFYGRIFVVPKASGGWRPVLDLSHLNQFLQRIHFKMETASSIRDSTGRGDWAISLGLSGVYFYLLVHRRDRKWPRFAWRGRVFQFRALPFGLSLALWVFTKVTRELTLLARSKGYVYDLDDWLILADSRQKCSACSQFLLHLASRLGFVPNLAKSELVPSQSFAFGFLGMHFDTVAWSVRPVFSRLDRHSSTLSSLGDRPSASTRDLASLLGQMESLASLLPLGRLHKRQFQRDF